MTILKHQIPCYLQVSYFISTDNKSNTMYCSDAQHAGCAWNIAYYSNDDILMDSSFDICPRPCVTTQYGISKYTMAIPPFRDGGISR
jgi:hypothetical protein